MISIIQLQDYEFTRFRDIIYNECGINLTERKKSLMQSRLMRRLREKKLSSYSEYYNYLQNNYNEEIVNLINCITTNKTDFFREPKQFDFLAKNIYPTFPDLNDDEIRIWSAGCSTGEEPYSIAISILNHFNYNTPKKIKILATDIDTNVLKFAYEGTYDFSTIKNIDMEILKNSFYAGKEENKGLFKVKEKTKELIYFRKLNLLQEEFPMKKKFNIIFCRNVIIYFDKPTQMKLFQKFHSHLKDDGYLFLGHSETIGNKRNLFTSIGNSIFRKAEDVY